MNKPREEGEHAVAVIVGQEVFMEDFIMESILGRKLQDDEAVFHRNGNTLDNQRHNLYLVTFGIDMASRVDYACNCPRLVN
jgi:hypothetical protein